MKVLNIISCGYRATLEEQDDTIVWITHAIRGAGADIDILLRGPATNYVATGQKVSPISIGGREQKHAPDIYGQVASLAGKEAKIFVAAEDMDSRGLKREDCLPAAQPIRTDDLPTLIRGYDAVWHW